MGPIKVWVKCLGYGHVNFFLLFFAQFLPKLVWPFPFGVIVIVSTFTIKQLTTVQITILEEPVHNPLWSPSRFRQMKLTPLIDIWTVSHPKFTFGSNICYPFPVTMAMHGMEILNSQHWSAVSFPKFKKNKFVYGVDYKITILLMIKLYYELKS